MPGLFEESEISGMRLANRFVRSATWEGLARTDGSVTAPLCDLMARLAEAQIGLLISSHAYVAREGQAGPGQLGIHADEMVEGLRNLTDAVHGHGGKVAAQIAHAGRFANQDLSGLPPVVVEELDQAGIDRLIRAFAQGARRAQAAGFDAVQIHAAHGYLLSQFLSPAYNRRTDTYGGAVENRARALLEVFTAVRGEVGPDFPVLVKMNCQDFCPDGLGLDDAVAVAKMLETAGIDAIEISGGTRDSGRLIPSRRKIDSAEKEAYFRPEAAVFSQAVSVPLLLVGGIRSLEIAEQLYSQGVAHYISLCRPLIREPNLVQRWAAGDRRPATCLSDNLCYQPARSGEGIHCVVDRRIQARESDQ